MARIEDRETCRCLRTKGMFIDSEPDPAVPNPKDENFWCIHTQNLLGPDGGLAEPERCRPGRECYEPR